MLTVEGIGGTGAFCLLSLKMVCFRIRSKRWMKVHRGNGSHENGCLITEAAEIIEPDSLQVEWLFLEDVCAGLRWHSNRRLQRRNGTVVLTLNGNEEYKPHFVRDHIPLLNTQTAVKTPRF